MGNQNNNSPKNNDQSSQQQSTDGNEDSNQKQNNSNNISSNNHQSRNNSNIPSGQNPMDNNNPINVPQKSSLGLNALSEASTTQQHYLKFLQKNNFVSLTFEELCAFMVQYHWRRYYIELLRKKRRGMIDIIYSTLELNANVSSHQNQAFLILDNKKYPYRCYDLMTYKNLSKTVEKLGGFEVLPCIFINGYYIGTTDHLQELEDMKLINKIINGEYNESCLMCHVLRSNPEFDTCPYCYKKYLFFSQDNKKYDIYNNRN